MNGYPKPGEVRHLHADDLPEPYRTIVAKRVAEDGDVFAASPGLVSFERAGVWGELYPHETPPGARIRVLRVGAGLRARMLMGDQPAPSKRFDPTHPAPIWDAYIGRIVDHLAANPGVRPTTSELAGAAGVPRKAFENNFFRRRLRHAGVHRTKPGGTNRWHLGREGGGDR